MLNMRNLLYHNACPSPVGRKGQVKAAAQTTHLLASKSVANQYAPAIHQNGPLASAKPGEYKATRSRIGHRQQRLQPTGGAVANKGGIRRAHLVNYVIVKKQLLVVWPAMYPDTYVVGSRYHVVKRKGGVFIAVVSVIVKVDVSKHSVAVRGIGLLLVEHPH